ncbi:MAG: energy coupling factor transporter S component ThiW, partial [Atribacterota bacterium]
MDKHVRLLAYTGLFVALGVVASGVHIPVGPTKVFPFQHALNVLAGISVGPWYGALAAFITGVLRIMLGTGTIFSLPGGIPGVVVVGYFYHYVKRSDWMGLLEPLGTGPVGATLSTYVVAPLVGRSATLFFFQSAFLLSSIPGSIVGLLLVKILRRMVDLETWRREPCRL